MKQNRPGGCTFKILSNFFLLFVFISWTPFVLLSDSQDSSVDNDEQ